MLPRIPFTLPLLLVSACTSSSNQAKDLGASHLDTSAISTPTRGVKIPGHSFRLADGRIARPTDSGRRPIDSGTRPVDSGTRPVDSRAQSVDSGAQPVDSAAMPVDSAAPTADAEVPPDAGTGCGAVTLIGCCAGTVLVICDASTSSVTTGDCAPYTCGWDSTYGTYACGFVGADPSGANPIDCPTPP